MNALRFEVDLKIRPVVDCDFMFVTVTECTPDWN